ncbi:hypothetical protein [Parvicella tangerina]|uniref:Uncharacterized protein n=1 Tax=Parvicella tangerina TaxID=2829795 RepID=A0A916JMH7_9FLAO|nr:hypothetical protein [Parvicella tangerina]CAG5080825.1 hypothetical protein CRYO30217_01454 [Parvicella tangerina]
MELVRTKLQHYNIEWDGPIIFLKDDTVTILSPFRILQLIENTSSKVRAKVYQTLTNLTSREEVLSYLEKLGNRLLTIKL